MVDLRAVMVELGMRVVNARDFCGMGIRDPKGK
jgi:hypothetical protein